MGNTFMMILEKIIPHGEKAKETSDKCGKRCATRQQVSNTHQWYTVKQDQVSNAIRDVYTTHPNRISRTTSHSNTRDRLCTPVTVARITCALQIFTAIFFI
ncbi:hypothetical protein DPMN_180225 [Dreissena polymorpha]|uniref:Uncharacterized protein n=1 Tax=Dreissena polymorpha TaxID=45954 RepID=A0A9D4EGJ6_DREPO|nr:hypothetical protein DPMN_180225 [Dreissena polymorpha]